MERRSIDSRHGIDDLLEDDSESLKSAFSKGKRG